MLQVAGQVAGFPDLSARGGKLDFLPTSWPVIPAFTGQNKQSFCRQPRETAWNRASLANADGPLWEGCFGMNPTNSD